MKEKLIYLYPALSSFVQKDLDMLKQHFQVRSTTQKWGKKWALPLLYFRQLVWLLVNQRNCRYWIVMFAGHHSLIPAVLGRLLNRQVYIILGGTECVSFPKFGYGSLRKPLLKRVIKWTYRFSSMLIPVHQALLFHENLYVQDPAAVRQGVRAHFPKLNVYARVIHNGFEASDPPSTDKVAASFITVADVGDRTRFYVKGIDKILYLADHVPEASFTIVGMRIPFPKDMVVPKICGFSGFYLLRNSVLIWHLRNIICNHPYPRGFLMRSVKV